VCVICSLFLICTVICRLVRSHQYEWVRTQKYIVGLTAMPITVLKWLCTEMVCTEVVMYRNGHVLKSAKMGVQFQYT